MPLNALIPLHFKGVWKDETYLLHCLEQSFWADISKLENESSISYLLFTEKIIFYLWYLKHTNPDRSTVNSDWSVNIFMMVVCKKIILVLLWAENSDGIEKKNPNRKTTPVKSINLSSQNWVCFHQGDDTYFVWRQNYNT